MGRVGQDWLVLTQLTDHSSSALGIVTGLQFLPFLLLAPVAGMIADRFSKRHILLMTQSFLGLSALALAVLTLTGRVSCGTSTSSPSSRASPPRSTTRPGSPSCRRWSPRTG